VFPSKRKTPEPRKQIDRESQKAHRKSLGEKTRMPTRIVLMPSKND